VKRFKGFTKDSFNFFSELEKNNNSNWFSRNQERYNDVRKRLADLIIDIGELYIARALFFPKVSASFTFMVWPLFL